jgi:NTP pyrophosphatase (non-canonical NTP hydrolase)
MSDIKNITQKIIAFRDARDWKQFHNPKDCAISLSLEASEVLEHFQWKSEEEVKDFLLNHKDDLAEELADVFNFLLLMCHDLDIDIVEASEKKLVKNDLKYPVEKARGRHTKYDKL